MRGLGDDVQDTKRCPTCKKFILTSQYDLHMDNHAQQQRMREIQETIRGNEQDKGGIEVNWKNGVDFLVVTPDTIVEVEVRVVNTTAEAILLQTCRIGKPDVREQDKL